MSNYLPVLKGRPQSKFNNLLSGFVYDNKKYADSCFIDAMPPRGSVRSRSLPNSFIKRPQPRPLLSSEDLADKQLRMSKVFNLTKRLSDRSKLRCSRSQWLPSESQANIEGKKTAPIQQLIPARGREGEARGFRFPEIRALILSVFRSPADLDKVCKLSLKSYFQLFFKDTLSGPLFHELISIVEKLLFAIVQREDLCGESQETVIENDAEFANILTKQELYNKLVELEGQGKREAAERVVRTYCLPGREMRQVFMQDLLKLIAVQLYQNFNCNRHSEYVLLREGGQPISDFASIGFSTTFLFIAERGAEAEQFRNYIEITQNQSRLKNRFQFREQLKANFRQKVARGNFFDSPQKPRKQDINQRRNNLDRAQMIVDAKNEKNNPARKDHTKNNNLLQGSKSKSKEKREKSEGKAVEGERPMLSSIDIRIEEEFKELKRKNDFINSILKNDQQARGKIQLGLLCKESVYFREKSLLQAQRILFGMGFIDEGQPYECYHQRLITLNHYSKMRKVINCVGERQHTVRFVDRYLGYDEFGQLRREDFLEVVRFIVGSEGKTADVILNTIWSWLQHNGATSPSGIRRLDMQLLYQRNKLVYYFLISLIFGTNEVSVVQLTNDMLTDG